MTSECISPLCEILIPPSTEHATAPDAFESQPGGPGDDVHDHVSLSALANIVRSPGGVRSASKGGRNYAWTNTESLAAVLARESANNSERCEKQEVRAKDCQRRFIGTLRTVESAHAPRKGIPRLARNSIRGKRRARKSDASPWLQCVRLTPRESESVKKMRSGRRRRKFSPFSRGSCWRCGQSDCANLAPPTTIAWWVSHPARLIRVRARVDRRSPHASIARRTKIHPTKTQPNARPTCRVQPNLRSHRLKKTFHRANLSSATRRLRRARYQSLPSKMKCVCHPQTSRPRVRLEDRLARRGPVCVCEECKRRMDSTSTWRIIIHVHYIAARCKCKISPLSLRTTLRRVACRWSTPPSFVMGNQAILACPVCFKIFYRRSVKARHSPLKHSSPCYSHIQCSVIPVNDGVDDFHSAVCVSAPPSGQTMRVIFRVLHVTLVPRLDHSVILLVKLSHIHSIKSRIVISQQPSPCEYIV